MNPDGTRAEANNGVLGMVGSVMPISAFVVVTLSDLEMILRIACLVVGLATGLLTLAGMWKQRKHRRRKTHDL